jgi:hypothetical protein
MGFRRLLVPVLSFSSLVVACTGGSASSPSVLSSPSRSISTPVDPVPVLAAPDDAAGHFELVGSDPLFARGMNAGLAVDGGYAYVGSRTDGSPGHRHPGVLVVDVRDPRRPAVVGEIGPPHEATEGASSRELRVWRARHLLIVLNIRCSRDGHDCAELGSWSVDFYDIQGDLHAAPVFVSEYVPDAEPHEMFLWTDPDDPARAVLFLSAPTTAELLAIDISGAANGRFRLLASWDGGFTEAEAALHSLSVSQDGDRAYLAYLAAGFLVLDTSEVAAGTPHPELRQITPSDSRIVWDGHGAHSAIALPGRSLVLLTEEVYGGPMGGCPWGWIRFVDIRDPVHPRLVSGFGVAPWNDVEACSEIDPEVDARASFSSHDPTATEHLALVSWHAVGLVAIATDDPAAPALAAVFRPEPLGRVGTEDPELTSGSTKVATWSYPIVSDGLVYVVDIRNGLFIVRYEGPHAGEIDSRGFLEGNSNQTAAR